MTTRRVPGRVSDPQQSTLFERLAAADLAAGDTDRFTGGLPDRLGPDWLTTGVGFEPPEAEGDEDPERIWGTRDVFKHIYVAACARMVSPWAVLGVVLARVVAATPPHVQLPAIVGGHGSLNLFVALVGPSGSGKNAAQSVAREAVEVSARSGSTTGFLTVPLGSGEGLAHMFLKRPKPTKADPNPQPFQYNTAALVTVGEIDTLGGLRGRQGSTVMAQLRQAAMGEQLGFFYVDQDKRMLVADHSYRMSLVAGVQPARAGVLLEDADGGTPQRFLWLPSQHPDAPEEPPGWPEPLLWSAPPWPTPATSGAERGRVLVGVPEVAVEHTVAIRKALNRGEGDPLDGHANLTRLKVAAALAVLEGRTAVSEEDWELAVVVLERSDMTRARVVRVLRDEVRRLTTAQAHVAASQAEIVAERTDAATRKQVTATVKRALARLDEDGWLTSREIKAKINSRNRDVMDMVLDGLVETGEVDVQAEHEYRPGQFTDRYRLHRDGNPTVATVAPAPR